MISSIPRVPLLAPKKCDRSECLQTPFEHSRNGGSTATAPSQNRFLGTSSDGDQSRDRVTQFAGNAAMRHVWTIRVAPPTLSLDGEDIGDWDVDERAVMANLIYASNMSLDGCTEDERGAFDWAPPDDDVFAFITKLMRSTGTYLYGRRMYETLAVWETDPSLATHSDLTADYASAWQAADKVVYSSTLAAPPTANTRLERHFNPSSVLELKTTASRDLLVGGPNLAAQALVAGLVDEIALFVWPVILGGRNPLPPSVTTQGIAPSRTAPVRRSRVAPFRASCRKCCLPRAEPWLAIQRVPERFP